MNISARVLSVERRKTRISKLLTFEERKLRNLSTLRLFSFAAFFLWILTAYLLRPTSEIYYLPSVLFLAAFYRLLGMYQARKDKKDRLSLWIRFLEEQKARLTLTPGEYPRIKRELYRNLSGQRDLPTWTKDLDFLGESGIFSRIDTASTSEGQIRFLSYFLEPKRVLTSRERQSSVLKLSKRLPTVQKLLRLFKLYEASLPELEEKKEESLPSYIPSLFKKDSKDSTEEKGSPPSDLFRQSPDEFWTGAFGERGRIVRAVFPFWVAFNWIVVLGALLGGKTWGFGLFLLNLSLFGFYRGTSLDMIRSLAKQSESLPRLGKILNYAIRSNLAGSSGKKFFSDWSPQEFQLCWNEFTRIANRAAFFQAPLPHSSLNFLFLFDLWLWKRYDRWWKRWGSRIASAFSDLAELDSILPLANLKWLEPTFSFPNILGKSESAKLEAKALVHPLIQAEKRVPNDLEKVSPGDIFLLTGSNMSGKTTYLRSAGICGILAMSGGPVPASECNLPLLEVHSSVRNEDSVEKGISFFYAEVRRLAKILSEVSDTGVEHLVLLDEILKGTNSRERTLACKGILKTLKKSKVFGIVTTHDLELAGLEGLELRHFREEIKDGKMSFDYKIRNGVVQSSNALEVLKLEGLDLDFS
ncbi:DNA mismatch repair protein [Leptospira fletcheri]|uniref:DNA mismatch repair protein n=1 Tax=Leptospira fletcheri TaxID=2484981 RepID=A0A4V6QKR7_9LEPT|nr:DNA mismatch repair protein [Leptospira fletcheri]TGK11815.1 DNA mismatch repair protein [Leptospira fletcheri]